MTDPLLLRRYVRDGRLMIMPAKRDKRLAILDHIVQVFEPGKKYTETEVSATLAEWYDDYAALRRYLVDEGLLSRENNVYWRSGGTVDV